MKTSTATLTILLLAAAGGASATQISDHRGDQYRRDDTKDRQFLPRDEYQRSDRGVGASAQSAPEISPGTMVAALTLLGGALIVMRGRRNTRPADRA
jgi:hypothetical protein